MDVNEAAYIDQYKRDQSHLPDVDTLGGLWSPDFDPSAYLGMEYLHALEAYLQEQRKYSTALSKAARSRQSHYDVFIRDKREEDSGHRYWREGMNEIALDAEEKLSYWSKVRETKFDEAVRFSDLMESLVRERGEKRFVPTRLEAINIDRDATLRGKRVSKPKLSEAEKKRRKREAKERRAAKKAEESVLLEEKQKDFKEFYDAREATRKFIYDHGRRDFELNDYLFYVPRILRRIKDLAEAPVGEFGSKEWIAKESWGSSDSELLKLCSQALRKNVTFKEVDYIKLIRIMLKLLHRVAELFPVPREITDLCGKTVYDEHMEILTKGPYSVCHTVFVRCRLEALCARNPEEKHHFFRVAVNELYQFHIEGSKILYNALIPDFLGEFLAGDLSCPEIDYCLSKFAASRPDIYPNKEMVSMEFAVALDSTAENSTRKKCKSRVALMKLERNNNAHVPHLSVSSVLSEARRVATSRGISLPGLPFSEYKISEPILFFAAVARMAILGKHLFVLTHIFAMQGNTSFIFASEELLSNPNYQRCEDAQCLFCDFCIPRRFWDIYTRCRKVAREYISQYALLVGKTLSK